MIIKNKQTNISLFERYIRHDTSIPIIIVITSACDRVIFVMRRIVVLVIKRKKTVCIHYISGNTLVFFFFLQNIEKSLEKVVLEKVCSGRSML